MYDFEPSDEQRMLCDAVRRFAVNNLRAAYREADEHGELPQALIETGWELGVLQASIPEAYGGFGDRSAVTAVLAAEEMAWGDLAATLAVMAPSSYALPILLCGTEEQKTRLLEPVIEGEWRPYVAALTEPSFDFYAADLKTRAVKSGEGYSLTGEKICVPFADRAPGFLVYAELDGRTQAFVVPAGTEGLEIGKADRLMGIRALPTYQLLLKNVRVPAEARLGGEAGCDPDLIIASSQVTLAAMAVGMSNAAYEYALQYAKEREAFDQKIAQKQAIAFMLAEMVTEIEAIRLLVWEAAWKLDQGLEDAPQAAYLALTGASETAMVVTDRAVQILGGHGYIREHPVELWMRNARGIANFTGMAAA